MSEVESSIKPEEIPAIKHDLNDRTYESYIEQGFEGSITHHVESPHIRLMDFLARAGEHPIEKKVWKMERKKHMGKEYLIVHMVLLSTDFWGDEAKVGEGDYQEGYWIEQTRRPKRDEQRRIVKYIRGQPIEHYTIEFNKENVDKYLGEQDPHSIDYSIHHEGGPQKGHFTYEQFVNNSWPDNMELLLIDGEPKYARYNRPKPQKA